MGFNEGTLDGLFSAPSKPSFACKDAPNLIFFDFSSAFYYEVFSKKNETHLHLFVKVAIFADRLLIQLHRNYAKFHVTFCCKVTSIQGLRVVVARLRDKLFVVYNFQFRFQNSGFCSL